MADIENTLRSDMWEPKSPYNVLVQNQLIINEVEKIESWKGDAYQTDDDIELALEEIKRLIGNQKLYE